VVTKGLTLQVLDDKCLARCPPMIFAIYKKMSTMEKHKRIYRKSTWQ